MDREAADAVAIQEVTGPLPPLYLRSLLGDSDGDVTTALTVHFSANGGCVPSKFAAQAATVAGGEEDEEDAPLTLRRRAPLNAAPEPASKRTRYAQGDKIESRWWDREGGSKPKKQNTWAAGEVMGVDEAKGTVDVLFDDTQTEPGVPMVHVRTRAAPLCAPHPPHSADAQSATHASHHCCSLRNRLRSSQRGAAHREAAHDDHQAQQAILRPARSG